MNLSKHAENLKIEIGAKPYGGIVYYSIKREVDEKSENIPKPKHYLITVKRVCRDIKYENVDPFDTYNVIFTVNRLGRKATFDNCVVDSVVEELGTDGEIYQTVNLTAPVRHT